MFPFFILTICKSEYICIAVNKKKKVLFGASTRVSRFLEILVKPSCFPTFGTCGCKRGVTCRSQGSCWPLWPRSHLWAGENNNPERSVHEALPPSAGTCSFIQTGRLFTDSPRFGGQLSWPFQPAEHSQLLKQILSLLCKLPLNNWAQASGDVAQLRGNHMTACQMEIF